MIGSAATGGHGNRSGDRRLVLRSATWADSLWLLLEGLDPRKIGEQYSVWEAPLQLLVAPLRAFSAPWRRTVAAIVEVDGRRAGYIGPNPLSANLEYFVARWARGGIGRRLIATYLGEFRRSDRSRRFFISYRNERSKAALLGALGQLGWSDYRVEARRHGWHVIIPATTVVDPA
ncbi:MAG: hypothetical protein N2037_06835 [Acidimicrobiales bacterium]|nr:hypothetical protein [Acidimicrobiales bacterium]